MTPLAARDVSLAEPRSLEKRGATILLFDGDGCTGGAHSIVQETGNWCYPVPQPKRSLHGVGKYVITLFSLVEKKGEGQKRLIRV